MRASALAAAALLAFMLPMNAVAQQITDSFQDLARRALLEAGDELRIICDLRGTGEYTEISAEFVSLTDAALFVRVSAGLASGTDLKTVSLDDGKQQLELPEGRVAERVALPAAPSRNAGIRCARPVC